MPEGFHLRWHVGMKMTTTLSLPLTILVFGSLFQSDMF